MFGAGVWPVVQRELRAAARWPLGHWLRVAGALGGLIAFWISTDLPFDQMGVDLFQRVHALLLGLICAIVPALTADCLARERREGTLGLLFMTPLTAPGIVLGKALAQMLRALTVWLAVVPILTIPFLTGGVTGSDLCSFLVVELCAGFLCVAAGIVASSLTYNRGLAFVFAFLLMGALVAVADCWQIWAIMNSPNAPTARTGGTWGISPPVFVSSGLVSPMVRLQYTSGSAVWSLGAGGLPFALLQPPPGVLAEDFLLAFLVLLAALRFAGRRVESSWQDKIPSVRRQGLIRRYCTPVFKRWFANRMSRTLDWNPIAWLQQYSWKARLSKWGLCLLFVLLECVVIDGDNPDRLTEMLTVLLLLLAGAYTFAGINGFFHEKNNGALELILVTPLSVNQILFGRLWGLWKQFLPATLLLVGSDIAVYDWIPQFKLFGGYWPPERGLFWTRELEIAAIFLTMPVVATFFALSVRNLFVAFGATVFVVFTPDIVWLFSLLDSRRSWPPDPTASDPMAAWVCVCTAHVWFALFAYHRLQRNLARRSYGF